LAWALVGMRGIEAARAKVAAIIVKDCIIINIIK
jgi:hypothetical protein